MAIITVVVLQALLGFIMEGVFVRTMQQLNAWKGDNSSCNCADECRWVGTQIVMAIATLPLNFIPVLGTLAFCAINGALMGWEYHEIYFDMCGMSKRQQREEVYTHWRDYVAFGLASQLMLLVPCVGPFTFVVSQTFPLYTTSRGRIVTPRVHRVCTVWTDRRVCAVQRGKWEQSFRPVSLFFRQNCTFSLD